MEKKLFLFILLFQCIIISSCIKTKKNFVENNYNKILNEDVDRVSGCAIAIRYPVMFSSYDAKDKADNIWKKCIYNLENKNLNNDESVDDRKECDYSDSVKISLVKTHYYVMELFNSLKIIFPENKIILYPVMVDYVDGKFKYVYDESMIPTGVVVDFFVIVDDKIDSSLTTAGNNFFPFLSVKTNKLGSESTDGALLVTTDKNSIFVEIEDESKHLFNNPFASNGISLADILNSNGLLDKGKNHNLTEFNDSIIQKGLINKVDLSVYDLDEDQIAKQNLSSSSSSPTDFIMEYYAVIIKNIINSLEYRKIVNSQYPYYIKIFDEDLSTRYLNQQLILKDDLRIEAILNILDSEIKYKSKVSDLAYDKIYNNDFGKVIRKMTADEVSVCNKRTSQKIDNALAVFTGILAVATSATVISSGAPVNVPQYQYFLEQSFDLMQDNVENAKKTGEQVEDIKLLYQELADNTYSDSVTIGGQQVTTISQSFDERRKELIKLYKDFVSKL